MSLFGESPPDNPSSGFGAAGQSKSSDLFGDEGEAPASKRDTPSGLFADNGADDSPWSMPTPKKQNRQDFVKNLLPPTQVPESYVDAYDTLIASEESRGAGLTLSAVRSLLASSNLSAGDQDRILDIVLPSGQDSASALGRGQFNVLLALIGLGQEEEEITLDSVDERRKRMSSYTRTRWKIVLIPCRSAGTEDILSRRNQIAATVESSRTGSADSITTDAKASS